jgi:anaerobic selenocysteine-containing dehydrogenase
MGFDWVAPEERALTLGLDERPQGPPQKGWITSRDLFRAVVEGEPYPVTCFVSFGSNFLLSKPNTRLAEAALEKLDFFALTELVETPTARYADLLLPVCSAWEREGLQAGFQVARRRRPICNCARPSCRRARREPSDTWIVFELAKRLGLADQFFGGDPEAGPGADAGAGRPDPGSPARRAGRHRPGPGNPLPEIRAERLRHPQRAAGIAQRRLSSR